MDGDQFGANLMLHDLAYGLRTRREDQFPRADLRKLLIGGGGVPFCIDKTTIIDTQDHSYSVRQTAKHEFPILVRGRRNLSHGLGNVEEAVAVGGGGVPGADIDLRDRIERHQIPHTDRRARNGVACIVLQHSDKLRLLLELDGNIRLRVAQSPPADGVPWLHGDDVQRKYVCLMRIGESRLLDVAKCESSVVLGRKLRQFQGAVVVSKRPAAQIDRDARQRLAARIENRARDGFDRLSGGGRALGAGAGVARGGPCRTH